MTPGEILWRPNQYDITQSRLHDYKSWLSSNKGLHFPDYESLWQWSVDDPDTFWETVISFFNVKLDSPYSKVLSGNTMPDVQWFAGARLNYAEHIYRGMSSQTTAILFYSEHKATIQISVDEMWKEVTRLQLYFKNMGVKPGDRIAGYLPTIPEATYAFLAAVSMGAIWSCCSPDFGVSSVVDRFAQIEPVIFIAADGYFYGGKTHFRAREIKEILHAIPSIKNALVIRYVDPASRIDSPKVTYYKDLVDSDAVIPEFTSVPFEHPLWILYSSGTTGAPKAITHSHGGCLLEHLKYLAFHNDVHPGEIFFWYTTTGWMMWNFLHASMLHGATMVLYDGSPSYPSLNALWEVASDLKIDHFGTSAPYLVACMKENLKPGAAFNLTSLRSIGSTGSPLPAEAFDWVYNSIHDRIWLCSMSGGTDVCTAFVGGVIEKNVVKGEIQARGLGCSLYAFDDTGRQVVDSLGEMVITKPMPSMPIYFWKDENKNRYRSSYFDDIPGVWRHGDWVRITKEGGIIIYGRSDATLNKQGIRIGTAEIYRVMNEVPEIEDSLIVNLELEGGRHYMPLFVKMRRDAILSDVLIKSIVHSLKTKCSPRHVPDDVIQVPDIPYTISGKKMEAPVKKILMGMATDQSLNKDAMRNPESLVFFENFIVPG